MAHYKTVWGHPTHTGLRHGGERVSVQALTFWGLLTANLCTLSFLLHKACDSYSQNTIEVEFIKLKLESLNGERLDAFLVYMLMLDALLRHED